MFYIYLMNNGPKPKKRLQIHYPGSTTPQGISKEIQRDEIQDTIENNKSILFLHIENNSLFF